MIVGLSGLDIERLEREREREAGNWKNSVDSVGRAYE